MYFHTNALIKRPYNMLFLLASLSLSLSLFLSFSRSVSLTL